uniref:EF-hand domain-containing protein n=1 Tax=Haptolina brevifila TaxID=156173 RepID=A0A7S2BSG7_9EUKA
MAPTFLFAALAFASFGLANSSDPRVCAIRSKSLEELKAICDQAQVPYQEDDDAETIRAALYAKMQTEIPGSTGVKPWPGVGKPGECDDFKPKGGKTQGAPAAEPDLSKVSSMLFKRLDADGDGKLSRTEMQGMIDTVNAEATRKGEPTYDLFDKLDQNKDSVVDREESEAFFKTAVGGGSAPKATPKSGAGSDVSSMRDGVFKSFDRDKNGMLSKEEFEPLRAEWAKKADADGEAEGDFFATLDTDSDGMISMAEMLQGLATMTSAVKDEL